MMIINALGLLLIVWIVWWFWLYKPKEVSGSEEEIIITVDNGIYEPARIRLPAGKTATVHFLRKDASPCASMVQIPDLEISEELPLEKSKSINLPVMSKGEYAFHCQMQMYRGMLIVD